MEEKYVKKYTSSIDLAVFVENSYFAINRLRNSAENVGTPSAIFFVGSDKKTSLAFKKKINKK